MAVAGLALLTAFAAQSQSQSLPASNVESVQAAPAADAASAASGPAADPTANSAQDFALDRLLRAGMARLRGGAPERAIAENFDLVIAAYQVRYPRDVYKPVTGRSPEEIRLYLAMPVPAGEPVRIKVTAPILWADALYLKGYALIDLKQFTEARAAFESALALSPRNARYRAELGNVYIAQRDWPAALRTLALAADDARDVSPPELRNRELGRVWASMGFVQVQQGRLDEAEALFVQCLVLDPNDLRARDELDHVRAERDRQLAARGELPARAGRPPPTQEPVRPSLLPAPLR